MWLLLFFISGTPIIDLFEELPKNGDLPEVCVSANWRPRCQPSGTLSDVDPWQISTDRAVPIALRGTLDKVRDLGCGTGLTLIVKVHGKQDRGDAVEGRDAGEGGSRGSA